MIPKEECYVKEGEFGTPYTLEEAKLATDAQDMDDYHKGIMSWLIYEVERLTEENRRLEEDLDTANHEWDWED